jgi:hypothetical protein
VHAADASSEVVLKHLFMETRPRDIVGDEIMPRTCEPTSTSPRSPEDRTCIWSSVRTNSLRTPSIVVRSEAERPAMQQLRDSESRARELAQRMLDSVHRLGPREASDKLHVADTPTPRFLEQSMKLAKHFSRGDSTGHLFAPTISCRDGISALNNMVTVVDGRGVTVFILIMKTY